ncbi:hypothetical protein SDC9_211985 [bioreactor metagenome]|uniref:Uncharacterized protein n=1 Tax=bioreactor metagenome TaxID=1076179 RepID=A0A645JX85_9ZZZZ
MIADDGIIDVSRIMEDGSAAGHAPDEPYSLPLRFLDVNFGKYILVPSAD